MLSALELITLQVEALFTYDAAGRILHTNESEGVPAPRVFLGRTREGHVLRLRHDIPDDLATRLTALARDEPVEADLEREPVCAGPIRGLFRELASLAGESSGGPAFRFPDAFAVAGTAVKIDGSNAHLLAQFPWLAGALWNWRPCFAVVAGGSAVSVCFSSRRSDRVAEAGVETLPGYRGRGYARAATAAWAVAVRGEGLIPLYSTSWTNLASRGVARHLGLIQYGSDWSFP